MKVLHVTPHFYPAHYWGGPIVSVYGLCNSLMQLPGVNLRVLTTDSAGPKVSDRVPATSFPVRYSPGYDVYFLKRIAGESVAPGLLLELYSMIDWADVIHLTYVYYFPTIPTLAACKSLGKPLIWSPRGSFYRWDGQRRQHMKALWLKCCRSVIPSRTVIHCASIKEKMEAEWRMPSVRTAVVSNGVEIPTTGKSFRASSGEQLSLLYLGVISPVKGLDVLLHAMALLDRGIKLDVYGHVPLAYEDYGKAMSRLVDDLALRERVIFHGFVENELKTNAFLNADICVVPSHSENFSNVVAEALAYGVPVIASTGTPWSGVVEHGCGEWVDKSPASLAASILRMRHKPLQEMGGRGRDWMQREFGWSSVATKMEALYKRVIEQD